MISEITYRTKFEMVQTLRKYLVWFYSLCECRGPIPIVGDSKASEHDLNCGYRKRVEETDV